MQNQPNSPDPIPMGDLMRLANSPAGRQLLQMLQSNGGDALQQAISSATAGDYRSAQQTISALLDNPEAKKLLQQLGR